MTFLELCQSLALEAGISGGIASASGQVGEAQRVVRWVARAYRYIQNLHQDWKFLRCDVEFPVSPDTGSKYNAAAAGVDPAEFGSWCFLDKWRAYRTESGYADEQELDYVDYDDFRRTYMLGNSRLQPGRPQVVTVAPDQSLIVWPTPGDSYTIVGEQYRAPAIMKADTDTPIFAARFHDAIMYRALFYYGEFEGDGTVMATAQTELDRELAPMESLYLPSITMRATGALA
jgi:hypothetical protein